MSHFILPICGHSDESLPCKCIRSQSLRLIRDRTLDESYLRSAFSQPQDDTHDTSGSSGKCLCIRLTHRVALDLRLVREVDTNNRLDGRSMALVTAAEQLQYQVGSCTPEKLPCMTANVEEQEELAGVGLTHDQKEKTIELLVKGVSRSSRKRRPFSNECFATRQHSGTSSMQCNQARSSIPSGWHSTLSHLVRAPFDRTKALPAHSSDHTRSHNLLELHESRAKSQADFTTIKTFPVHKSDP